MNTLENFNWNFAVSGITFKKFASPGGHQVINWYKFINILKALTKLILLSKNKNDISETQQILRNLESFIFVLTFVFVSAILRKVDRVSQLLQKMTLIFINLQDYYEH